MCYQALLKSTVYRTTSVVARVPMDPPSKQSTVQNQDTHKPTSGGGCKPNATVKSLILVDKTVKRRLLMSNISSKTPRGCSPQARGLGLLPKQTMTIPADLAGVKLGARPTFKSIIERL